MNKKILIGAGVALALVGAYMLYKNKEEEKSNAVGRGGFGGSRPMGGRPMGGAVGRIGSVNPMVAINRPNRPMKPIGGGLGLGRGRGGRGRRPIIAQLGYGYGYPAYAYDNNLCYSRDENNRLITTYCDEY